MDVTLPQLAEMISSGQTWCPVHFSERRKVDCFQSAQMLVLDFDSGTPYEEVMARAETLGIAISLSHPTYSHKPESPRYRLVWVLDAPVTEVSEYKRLLDALYKAFPEACKGCRNAAQMFHGTNQGIWYLGRENAVTADQVLEAACAASARTTGTAMRLVISRPLCAPIREATVGGKMAVML